MNGRHGTEVRLVSELTKVLLRFESIALIAKTPTNYDCAEEAALITDRRNSRECRSSRDGRQEQPLWQLRSLLSKKILTPKLLNSCN